MVKIEIDIKQEIWDFLNKKGDPALVVKQIIESAWEMSDRKMIIGILTNCHTGKDSVVNLEYHIKPSTSDSSRKIFTIIGGPTGYESFYIDEWCIENFPRSGWLACAGTIGKWDKLFIDAADMRKAFLEAGLIQ
ncbi:hypothetical protein [Candidatus Methanoperedens nitratireducens]|uniref:Uncharacterized protein n=1 Tax=Candidatus Methanoperedens nitratireducens TaxID=1392998 RepID=A0A284VNJ9_9EURY|nr:hypothetical protein [Candidatus Methanoperedens nitroreducens]SNQ60866.1 hypothetical protein MNV_2060008 [Candidatus Methanoperedens nitroreducens]